MKELRQGNHADELPAPIQLTPDQLTEVAGGLVIIVIVGGSPPPHVIRTGIPAHTYM